MRTFLSTEGNSQATNLGMADIETHVRHSLDQGAHATIEKSASQVIATEEQDDTFDEKYPEGGLQAWLVVLGSWCAMVPSMGLLNTISVLHAWTSTHQLSEYSESSVGWIFGVFSFFLYFAGAQVGMFYPNIHTQRSSQFPHIKRSG